MNERIKELAEQSMESTGVEGLGGCYMELNSEKFAELIVRECAVIANRAENNDTEIRCMYDVITEHFGVK